MNSQSDETVYYNFLDVIKVAESAGQRTTIIDKWLKDTEIIDGGIDLTSEDESYDDCRVKPQVPTPSSTNCTSPSRNIEWQPSIKISDRRTYAPNTNRKKIDEKVNTNDSDDDFDIVSVEENKTFKDNTEKRAGTFVSTRHCTSPDRNTEWQPSIKISDFTTYAPNNNSKKIDEKKIVNTNDSDDDFEIISVEENKIVKDNTEKPGDTNDSDDDFEIVSVEESKIVKDNTVISVEENKIVKDNTEKPRGTNNSDDEIVSVVENKVINNNVYKDKIQKSNLFRNGKKLSVLVSRHVNEKQRSIQKNNEGKLIDVKKNLGLVGIKVKPPSVDTKLNTTKEDSKNNIKNKIQTTGTQKNSKDTKLTKTPRTKLIKPTLHKVRRGKSYTQNIERNEKKVEFKSTDSTLELDSIDPSPKLWLRTLGYTYRMRTPIELKSTPKKIHRVTQKKMPGHQNILKIKKIKNMAQNSKIKKKGKIKNIEIVDTSVRKKDVTNSKENLTNIIKSNENQKVKCIPQKINLNNTLKMLSELNNVTITKTRDTDNPIKSILNENTELCNGSVINNINNTQVEYRSVQSNAMISLNKNIEMNPIQGPSGSIKSSNKKVITIEINTSPEPLSKKLLASEHLTLAPQALQPQVSALPTPASPASTPRTTAAPALASSVSAPRPPSLAASIPPTTAPKLLMSVSRESTSPAVSPLATDSQMPKPRTSASRKLASPARVLPASASSASTSLAATLAPRLSVLPEFTTSNLLATASRLWMSARESAFPVTHTSALAPLATASQVAKPRTSTSRESTSLVAASPASAPLATTSQVPKRRTSATQKSTSPGASSLATAPQVPKQRTSAIHETTSPVASSLATDPQVPKQRMSVIRESVSSAVVPPASVPRAYDVTNPSGLHEFPPTVGLLNVNHNKPVLTNFRNYNMTNQPYSAALKKLVTTKMRNQGLRKFLANKKKELAPKSINIASHSFETSAYQAAYICAQHIVASALADIQPRDQFNTLGQDVKVGMSRSFPNQNMLKNPQALTTTVSAPKASTPPTSAPPISSPSASDQQAPAPRASFPPALIPMMTVSQAQKLQTSATSAQQVSKSNLTLKSNGISSKPYQKDVKQLYTQKSQVPINHFHNAIVDPNTTSPYHIPTVGSKILGQNQPVNLQNYDAAKQQEYMSNQSYLEAAALELLHKTSFINETTVAPKSSNIASHYVPASASQAADHYAEQTANISAGNHPQVHFKTYDQNVMPSTSKSCHDNFRDFRKPNNNMYKQPTNYSLHPYSLGMQNYLNARVAYNAPNQTAYNPCGPMYAPPLLESLPQLQPPPKSHPTRKSSKPITGRKVPPKKGKSIVRKNNDGAIKEQNITSPCNANPLSQISDKIIENAHLCDNTYNIRPLSPILEMSNDLAVSKTNFKSEERVPSILPLITIPRPNSRRPSDSTDINEEILRRPPLKKKRPSQTSSSPELDLVQISHSPSDLSILRSIQNSGSIQISTVPEPGPSLNSDIN